MAKKNRFHRNAVQPKRKVGRYILLVVLLIPLAYQLKGVDIRAFVPKVDVDEKIQITNVIVEGKLAYTDKPSLQNEIIRRLETDFVRTDLKAIKAATLDIPWVRTASVSRVWPSAIKIQIEEQQPIARWGSVGFLNRHGEVVYVDDLSSLSHLPELNGPIENAMDIADGYLRFANLMSDVQLYVSSLTVSTSGEWHVEVNRAFTLSLGRHDLSKRVERFLYLYKTQLIDVQQDIENIDMRYKKGLAVSWKNKNEADYKLKNSLVIR